MIDKFYTFILTILFLLHPMAGFPAEQEIDVREIPSLDKLPVNTIHRIFQDSDGFIWYGTFNGLYRYDGYNIQRFRADFNHPGLISDNYITYITEDSDRNIWFGTTSGAYILNKDNNEITPIDLGELSNGNVFTISNCGGSIWVSAEGSLFEFESGGNLKKRYSTMIDGSPEYAYFVYEIPGHGVIVSLTGKGMFTLDKTKGTLSPFYPHDRYKHIERIIRDDDNGVYWLCTWGNGIVRFNPSDKDKDKIFTQQPLPIDITGKESGALYHMVKDDVFNYLWCTSYNDLFAFRINCDRNLEQINLWEIIPAENKTLYEIYKDKAGKLWVTSFDAGSFIIDIRKPSYRHYDLSALREALKRKPTINRLSVSEEGVFLLDQERYGLCAYDSHTSQFTNFTDSKDTKDLNLWSVSGFAKTGNPNETWVLTPDLELLKIGLTRSPLSMRAIFHTNLSDHIGTNIAGRSLLSGKDGNLWIGTSDGVYLYNCVNGSVTRMEGINGDVSAMTISGNGDTWVALKNNGVYRIHDGKIQKFSKVAKDIRSLATTSDGKLWFGTTEGEVMCMLPEDDGKIIDYSPSLGLDGDIINSLTVDSFNHIWISTGNSMKEFNPHNGAFRTHRTLTGDLPLTRLTRAVSYDGSGDIYFGGVDGIVAMTPGLRLESEPEKVTTHITDISINGTSIFDDSTHSFGKDNSLSLNHGDRNLEIKFSTLDFHNLDQVRYAYMLEGIDTDWNYIDGRENSVMYHHLPKGTFKFKVKGTDSNGQWSPDVTEITIRQKPAWYDSTIAYCIYSAILLCSIWILESVHIRRVKKKDEEKWSDSAEIVKMRTYVESNESGKSSEDSEIDNLLISRITSAVKENISKSDFTVSTLADAMNMSRSTLSRKIKAITGKTALEFIKDIKMHHAAGLLCNKTATVADVIYAVGYSDYKNFAQSFKDIIGMSPSEYMKQSKGDG